MGNNFTPNKCKTHFNLRKRCSKCIQAQTNLCLSLDVIVILKIHNITVYAVFCLQYSIMRSCHLSSPSIPSLMRQFSMSAHTHTHTHKRHFYMKHTTFGSVYDPKTRWWRIKRSSSTHCMHNRFSTDIPFSLFLSFFYTCVQSTVLFMQFIMNFMTLTAIWIRKC